MDDLASAGKSREEVKKLYTRASKRLEEGGFRLRKWHTNDKEISRLIHENENLIRKVQAELKSSVILTLKKHQVHRAK